MNSTKNGAVLPTNGAKLGEDSADLNLPNSFALSDAHILPPNSLEAEQSTLGAMLMDNAVIPVDFDIIIRGDIARDVVDRFDVGIETKKRALWSGCCALYYRRRLGEN